MREGDDRRRMLALSTVRSRTRRETWPERTTSRRNLAQWPIFNTSATGAAGRDIDAKLAVTVALIATVGLGAAGWIVTVQHGHGMDMGVATRLGPLSSFLGMWVPMMAAMMLPGTAPVVLRIARAGGRVADIPRYLGGYLAIWAVFGVAVYAAYRPHGTVVAGAFTLAAGVYELTPMKRRFREMGRDRMSSGLALGLCCVGSSIGLMLMMMALGVMSVTWMAVVAAVVLMQKLLPPRAAIDVAVAMAIVALGVAVVVAPSSVPGLVQPM
jgi:predicted metal-binding membrane protein